MGNFYSPATPVTASSINTALDTAWNVDTSVTITDLGGGTLTFGTGGETRIEWVRIGRNVIMNVFFTVGTSPSLAGTGLPWVIASTELPYAPKVPAGTYANPGGFGYFNNASSTAEAVNVGIKPAIAKIGSVAALVWIADPGDGGIGNLMWNGNPVPINAGATYQGQITYEAAAAA